MLGRDVGPIEPHIEALADEPDLPSFAIAQCALRIEESALALLAVLHKAAAGDELDEGEARLLFRGVHVLGGARRPEAFAPLLRLLRRPDVEELLGDAITETLPRIAAGAFDGDAALLFAAIEDESLDEFIRASFMGAATFLAWDKRIDRNDMLSFLDRFYEARRAPPGDYVWSSWAEAVARLGERDLAPKAYALFADGRVPSEHWDAQGFDAKLAAAERAPNDLARFQNDHLGYIEDVLAELERFPESYDLDDDSWDDLVRPPVLNPFRDVGRNDPCPCGSGKKFKKCCGR